LAAQLGTRFRYDPLIVGPDGDEQNVSELRLDESALDQLKKIAVTMERSVTPAENEDALYCNAGLNTFTISPYGDIYPCVMIRQTMGNAHSAMLSEIWQSERFNVFRKQMLGDLSTCRACPEKQFCNRCPGIALRESNDLQGADPGSCLGARMRRKEYEKTGAEGQRYI
jgi:radical SAM protein with 4Fe4S-binding SPASM domain